MTRVYFFVLVSHWQRSSLAWITGIDIIVPRIQVRSLTRPSFHRLYQITQQVLHVYFTCDDNTFSSRSTSSGNDRQRSRVSCSLVFTPRHIRKECGALSTLAMLFGREKSGVFELSTLSLARAAVRVAVVVNKAFMNTHQTLTKEKGFHERLTRTIV